MNTESVGGQMCHRGKVELSLKRAGGPLKGGKTHALSNEIGNDAPISHIPGKARLSYIETSGRFCAREHCNRRFHLPKRAMSTVSI